MNAGLLNQLDLLGRRTVPFALALALIIFSVLPWPLPGVTTVSPVPLLAAVYYWTVHRPELMPPFIVFVLGLMQDMLGGGPVGITPLVLLAVQFLVAWQSRPLARTSLLLDWWGFAVAAAGLGAATWLCTSIYYVKLVSPKPLLLQYLLGLCLYPILNWVFGLTRTLVRRIA